MLVKISKYLKFAFEHPNLYLKEFNIDETPLKYLTILDKTGEGEKKKGVTLVLDTRELEKKNNLYVLDANILLRLYNKWSRFKSTTIDDVISDLKKFIRSSPKGTELKIIQESIPGEKKDNSSRLKIVGDGVKIDFGKNYITAVFGNEYSFRAIYEAAPHLLKQELSEQEMKDALNEKIDEFIKKMKSNSEKLKNITPQEFAEILQKYKFIYRVTDLKNRKNLSRAEEPWYKKPEEDSTEVKKKSLTPEQAEKFKNLGLGKRPSFLTPSVEKKACENVLKNFKRYGGKIVKVAGEIRFIKDQGSQDNSNLWAFNVNSPTQRELKTDTFKIHSTGTNGLKTTLESTKNGLSEIMKAYEIFASIPSSNISPDGKLGGRGYIQKITDMRRQFMNIIEALSAIKDTIEDELSAPHVNSVDKREDDFEVRSQIKDMADKIEEVREESDGLKKEAEEVEDTESEPVYTEENPPVFQDEKKEQPQIQVRQNLMNSLSIPAKKENVTTPVEKGGLLSLPEKELKKKLKNLDIINKWLSGDETVLENKVKEKQEDKSSWLKKTLDTENVNKPTEWEDNVEKETLREESEPASKEDMSWLNDLSTTRNEDTSEDKEEEESDLSWLDSGEEEKPEENASEDKEEESDLSWLDGGEEETPENKSNIAVDPFSTVLNVKDVEEVKEKIDTIEDKLDLLLKQYNVDLEEDLNRRNQINNQKEEFWRNNKQEKEKARQKNKLNTKYSPVVDIDTNLDLSDIDLDLGVDLDTSWVDDEKKKSVLKYLDKKVAQQNNRLFSPIDSKKEVGEISFDFKERNMDSFVEKQLKSYIKK